VRWQVGDVALELFGTHGFDDTTVDQIAASAGISRSSFFRYFASKEDVVVLQMEESGVALLGALASRPADEPAWTALRTAFVAVVERNTREARRLERGLRVARVHAQTPSVRARVRDEMANWRDLLVPEVRRRMGSSASDPLDPRPAALAAAACACLDVACDLWQQSDGTASLADVLDTAMRQFDVGPD
jgi:AcrR family transcriptional regulator